MKISLIRHAPTRGNLQSNYIGATDEPLAPEGIELARKAGRDESVKEVYTSALARTRETAGILFPKAQQVVHAGLNEMNFGRFEGKSWRDLEEDGYYAAWLATHCESRCPGGESKEEFTSRCRTAFLAIVGRCRRETAEDLRFVVHGGVIMAIMSGFVVPERDYFSWRSEFCGGYCIESIDGDAPHFHLVSTIEPPGGGERT